MSRSASFSEVEKQILCDSVRKYKDVVLNKRTDTASCEAKKRAWVAITREFNTHHNITRRDDKQLKRCWEKLKCEAKKRKVADLRRKMGLTEETNAAQMEAGDASQDGVTEDTFDSDYRYLLAAASCPSAHQPAPSGSCGLRPTEPPHSPSDSRPIPSVSPTQSSVGSLSPSRPHYMSLPTAAPCINSTCPPSFSLADSEIHATNKSCRSDHQASIPADIAEKELKLRMEMVEEEREYMRAVYDMKMKRSQVKDKIAEENLRQAVAERKLAEAQLQKFLSGEP